MTIRLFMAGLLVGAFALWLGGLSLAFLALQSQLQPVIAGVAGNEAFRMAALQTIAAAFAGGLLFLVLAALLVERFLVRPVRSITAAMQELARTGSGTPPERRGWTPREIRSLERSFAEFAAGTDATHKRDAEISRVKSDFISTAAHQLRTPLTGIRWALEALELEALTEGQKALVASAVEKSRQLVAVVGTLLDISSIESGKYKYEMHPAPLGALAAEVTKDFATLAAEAKVSLRFEGADTATPVSMDRERIRWVLNNLVENAIRYTPQGGSVLVSTETAAGRAYVRVRDTGIGIAPKDQGNIFERFYRAPNAITAQNSGNGLGLYIARTIATDHGGDLRFESNGSSPGTVFILTLPVAA